MKFHHLLAFSVGLIGCSASDIGTAPADETIELIERRLESHPCIGNLDQWERNYRFARPGGLTAYTTNVDNGIVEFHLRRSGIVEIRPGRNALRRGDLDDWPDGPYVQSVDGYFDLGAHALSMPRCNKPVVSRRTDGASEQQSL